MRLHNQRRKYRPSIKELRAINLSPYCHDNKRMDKITLLKKKSLCKRTKLEDYTLWLQDLLLKATIIDRVLYWCQDRQMDQWNEMELTNRCTDLYGKLIYDKAAKASNEERTIFSTKGAETIGPLY